MSSILGGIWTPLIKQNYLLSELLRPLSPVTSILGGTKAPRLPDRLPPASSSSPSPSITSSCTKQQMIHDNTEALHLCHLWWKISKTMTLKKMSMGYRWADLQLNSLLIYCSHCLIFCHLFSSFASSNFTAVYILVLLQNWKKS